MSHIGVINFTSEDTFESNKNRATSEYSPVKILSRQIFLKILEIFKKKEKLQTYFVEMKKFPNLSL